MELAIPGVALGLLYVVSNQKKRIIKKHFQTKNCQIQIYQIQIIQAKK